MNYQILFQPTLSALIKNRTTCITISAATTLHLTLVSLGLPSWQCPLREVLGIPCPGCGLSRATSALTHGNWQDAMAIHAFAPIAIIVILTIFITSLIPNDYRISFANRLETIERSTGISNFVLILFVVYWIIRLLFFYKSLYFWVMV